MISEARRVNSVANRMNNVEDISLEWFRLENDMRTFEVKHNDYVVKLNQVESLKQEYSKTFSQHKHRLKAMRQRARKALDALAKEKNEKQQKESDSLANEEQTTRLHHTISKVDSELLYLKKIRYTLPRDSERYLKVVVGSVPLSILNKAEKWRYKEGYERFKLTVSMIISVYALILAITPFYSAIDYLFQFLLLWYYCTLTIRESILVVNGSQIRWWWRFHHFLACVNNGIIMMLPQNGCYALLRNRLIWYCFSLTCIQTLQFYYQKGIMYRMRALGESQQMDVSLEGMHAFTLRRLGFLVPFLLATYGMQAYYGYWMLSMYQHNRLCSSQWHILALAILMIVFAMGNVVTSLRVLFDKLSMKVSEYRWMVNKYQEFRSLLNFNGDRTDDDDDDDDEHKHDHAN